MTNALKKYIDDKGLTVADIAKITGLPYMTIRNHALGTRKLPNIEAALIYEKMLGIPVSFWSKEESSNPNH
jgi:plasmid maintenance system antidote protein VapI